MFYQSKYKELKIVIRATVKREVQGNIFVEQGEYIKFGNFRFVPKELENDEGKMVFSDEDKRKMKLLDSMIAAGKSDIWKITDEQLVMADAYQKEIEAVNKKFAEKRKFLKKLEVESTEPQIKRGVVGTGTPEQKESEVIIPADIEPKEKKYPEAEVDITKIEGGGNGKIEIDEPAEGDDEPVEGDTIKMAAGGEVLPTDEIATSDDVAQAAEDAVSDMADAGL